MQCHKMTNPALLGPVHIDQGRFHESWAGMNFDSYYTNLLEQLECDHGLEDWSGLLQAQSISIEGIVSNLMDTLIPMASMTVLLPKSS
jgi:hypothetical protein